MPADRDLIPYLGGRLVRTVESSSPWECGMGTAEDLRDREMRRRTSAVDGPAAIDGSRHRDATERWIRSAATVGILAVVVYSTFFYVPWGPAAGVVVASLFGIFLAVGCVGLRMFLTLHERSVAADVAAGLGVLAGATVMLMLIVQLAIRYPELAPTLDAPVRDAITAGLDRVHFGIDVAWDVFVASATLLFSVAAWSHPRLGRVIAVAGGVVALALLATNLATFPTPPASSGSVDIGPFIGLWYVVVSVLVLRSMPWVGTAVAGTTDPDA